MDKVSVGPSLSRILKVSSKYPAVVFGALQPQEETKRAALIFTRLAPFTSPSSTTPIVKVLDISLAAIGTAGGKISVLE